MQVRYDKEEEQQNETAPVALNIFCYHCAATKLDHNAYERPKKHWTSETCS